MLRKRAAKRRCKGIRNPRLDKYARSNPGWCKIVGVELRNSTYHSVSCGCGKNKIIYDYDRRISCNSAYGNITRDCYPELFDLADPASTQTALTVSHDKTIDDIRKEVIKIVTISGHSGTLDDPILLDHAALLHTQNMYLLDIGHR